MNTHRSQIIKLIEERHIADEKINEALSATKIFPEGRSWRHFIDQLLLWLGGLALAFAVMFFVAYNWQEIGRFAKFGIVEGFLLLAIVSYCKLEPHSTSGKISLLVATILLGVLLALFGQTYQTGADPWQLFFNWALFILPWAIVGRFPAIWIIWVVLINISIVLYHQTFRTGLWIIFDSDTSVLWLTFICNTLVLVLWEGLASVWGWLSERWALRLVAVGTGFPVSWLAFHAIFDRGNVGVMPGVAWAVWLIVLYLFYRKFRMDLFMLALGCLSGITVIVAFVGELTLKDDNPFTFLFLALLVISMGAGAAFWLRSIHQEHKS